MKKYKSKLYLSLILLILISSLLLGCDKSVVIKDLQVESDFYQEHGYFLGNNKVKFDVDVANFRKEKLVYYWQANGGRFLKQGESEVTYLTPKLPGNYNLRLEIKEGKQTLTTFNFSFTVKGDYPAEVVLEEVINESFSAGVKLNWSAYPNEDFYGYKILRSNNFYIDDKAKVIASIDDKSKTSYVDYEISPNQTYTYQIMVTNDRGYVSASNEELVKVLSTLMKKINVEGKLSQIIVNSQTGIGYIAHSENRKLLILNLEEDKIKEKLKLSIAPEKLIFSDDRNHLFVLGNKSNSLLKINTNNLAIEKYNLNYQIKDLAVGDNYLYLLTTGQTNLLKFNIKQGEVEEEISLTRNGKVIKGNSLDLINHQLLLVDEVFGPVLMYNLTDLSTVTREFNFGSVEDIKLNQVGVDQYLYVGTTESHSIQSFRLTSQGDLNQAGEFAINFYPTEFELDKKKGLLIAAYEAKEVSIFSVTNYSLLHKLKLDNYVFDLALDQHRDKLYLLTADIDQTNYNIIVVDLKTKGGNYIWNEGNS